MFQSPVAGIFATTHLESIFLFISVTLYGLKQEASILHPSSHYHHSSRHKVILNWQGTKICFKEADYAVIFHHGCVASFSDVCDPGQC